MANYHPTDELLMAFSAGQLPNALGLMLACHIEHCPDCQRKMHQFNELGGNILDSLEPLALDEGAIGKLLERLDEPEPVAEKVEKRCRKRNDFTNISGNNSVANCPKVTSRT
jgi:predicted ChrR family anti-sigma factor